MQTSTDLLRGRKLFVWGTGPGGRRWQEWLTEPGTGGYCEIQAGLVRTQLEHVRLEAESEVSWLEAYGPLDASPEGDWHTVLHRAEDRLEAALPRADVDSAYDAWRAHADTEPGERLATGSGWGALEVLRAGWKLPGTPFDEDTLGEEQRPWLHLLRTGSLPEPEHHEPPGGTLVAPPWRDMLETTAATPSAEYHLGVAQWHGDDRAQAVRSWERGLGSAVDRWPLLRCLAVADQQDGHRERAAERYAEAFDDLCARRTDAAEKGDGRWVAVTAALGREAIGALLAVGRSADARPCGTDEDPGRGPARHHRAGRRGLRHHRGVDAHRRAGHRRLDGQGHRLGQRADHRPHEGALALFAVPGVVVVRDPQRLEAGLLGHPRLLDQLRGTVLLAREEIAVFGHGGLPPDRERVVRGPGTRTRGRKPAARRASRRGRAAASVRTFGRPRPRGRGRLTRYATARRRTVSRPAS
ncbi:hypothetical protein SVIOM342S_04176 [Streptomyces violaceorubidus]